jgi:catechol 2,3-dioxygenase-like lactoylglutathione lyase family enzyme
MSDTPTTQGVHHVGLTVPELPKTVRFFIDTLGFSQVGEKPDYPAVFVSDGSTMITLWQAADPAAAVPFDRKNVIGLHHLALKVALRRLTRSTRGCAPPQGSRWSSGRNPSAAARPAT